MQNKVKPIIAVIGGDIRQVKLCALLAEDGYKIMPFALERCQSCDKQIKSVADATENVGCVILPMPVSRENGMLSAPLSSRQVEMRELIAGIKSGTTVLGGAISNDVRELMQKRGIKAIDYLAREDVAVANAAITAEGAIEVAMEELPITVNQSTCLVIGNGRIGKILAQMLRGLGADVTVAARKTKDLAYIKAAGHHGMRLPLPEQELKQFEIIFNTVPAMVLSKAEMRWIRSDALIIELASPPGGCDKACAAERGIVIKAAPGLPGKVAPLSAAKLLRDAIYEIIDEEGI